MSTFLQLVHFSKDVKHTPSTRWLANPNQGCSHFHHNFGSSYEYLIYINKVKIHVLIKWSYRPPHLCLLLSLELLSYFEHSPIFFNHMSFWYLFLELHSATYHSNTGARIRSITRLSTSTLAKIIEHLICMEAKDHTNSFSGWSWSPPCKVVWGSILH